MPYYDPADLLGSEGLLMLGAWVAAPGTEYGPYTWTHHQLLWIMEGSATIRVGDETHHATPDTVFHAPPHVAYQITWDPRRPTRLGYADFTADDPEGFPRMRQLEADDVILSLLNHVVWLSTDRPAGWIASARVAFDYALSAYKSGNSHTRVAVDGVYSELITRATSAMQRHWRGPTMARLSIRELANELGVSERHLTRVFTNTFGVGPVTTFRMLRVLEGARLLTSTTLPIREISTRVGFANEFHFSRVFKATVGVPPAEYRFRPPDRTPVPPPVARFHRTQGVHFHPAD